MKLVWETLLLGLGGRCVETLRTLTLTLTGFGGRCVETLTPDNSRFHEFVPDDCVRRTLYLMIVCDTPYTTLYLMLLQDN